MVFSFNVNNAKRCSRLDSMKSDQKFWRFPRAKSVGILAYTLVFVPLMKILDLLTLLGGRSTRVLSCMCDNLYFRYSTLELASTVFFYEVLLRRSDCYSPCGSFYSEIVLCRLRGGH